MAWCNRHTTRHAAVRWGKAQAVSEVTGFSSARYIPAGRSESTARLLCWGLTAHASWEDVPATSGPSWRGSCKPTTSLKAGGPAPQRDSTAPHTAQLKLTWSALPAWRETKQGRINRRSPPQGDHAQTQSALGEEALPLLQLIHLNWQKANFVSRCCCWLRFNLCLWTRYRI